MSHQEFEVKAVVPDAGALQERLRAAGATLEFGGRMADRLFDRAGELTGRDEVLRVRGFQQPNGRVESVLAWKGPTRRSADGHKLREEVELPVGSGAVAPETFLAALGYEVILAIDRYVERYRLGAATLRLEWYPRMDVLLEVEGEPEAIERAVEVTGLPRSAFTAEPLVEFVHRYEARTGRKAALALASLGEAAPPWPAP